MALKTIKQTLPIEGPRAGSGPFHGRVHADDLDAIRTQEDRGMELYDISGGEYRFRPAPGGSGPAAAPARTASKDPAKAPAARKRAPRAPKAASSKAPPSKAADPGAPAPEGSSEP